MPRRVSNTQTKTEDFLDRGARYCAHTADLLKNETLHTQADFRP